MRSSQSLEKFISPLESIEFVEKKNILLYQNNIRLKNKCWFQLDEFEN